MSLPEIGNARDVPSISKPSSTKSAFRPDPARGPSACGDTVELNEETSSGSELFEKFHESSPPDHAITKTEEHGSDFEGEAAKENP